MKHITLIRCDDNAIWVTSDDNPVGTESDFSEIKDEGKQMMIALANFLGYDQAKILTFDDLGRSITIEVKKGNK